MRWLLVCQGESNGAVSDGEGMSKNCAMAWMHLALLQCLAVVASCDVWASVMVCFRI
jgi:hypothetical protein